MMKRVIILPFLIAAALLFVVKLYAQEDCPPECEYCSVSELPANLTGDNARAWLDQCSKFCIDKLPVQSSEFGFSVGGSMFCDDHEYLKHYREVQTSDDFVERSLWVCNETSKTLDISMMVYTSCGGKACGATCTIEEESVYHNSGSRVLTDCRTSKTMQIMPGESFALEGSASAGYYVQNMNAPAYAATEIEVGLSPLSPDSRVFTQTEIVTPCQTLTMVLQNVTFPIWSPNSEVSCAKNEITLENNVACVAAQCSAEDTSMSIGWLSGKNPIAKAQIADTSSNVTWTQYARISYNIVLPGTYRKLAWLSPASQGTYSKTWREWEIATSSANYTMLYLDALQESGYSDCSINLNYCTWFAKKNCEPLETSLPTSEIDETGFVTESSSISEIPDLCGSPITETGATTITLPGGGIVADPGGGGLGERECFDIIAQQTVSQTSFIPAVSLCVTWLTLPEVKNLIPGLPAFLTAPGIVAFFVAFWYVKRLLQQFS